MVSQRRVVQIVVGVVVIAAAIWGVSYWRSRDTFDPEQVYHPEIYPEFSLTIEGKAPGPELELQESWDFEISSLRPADHPNETLFGALVSITAADDFDNDYGYCFFDAPPIGQPVTNSNGVTVHIPPSTPTLDDGRLLLRGVMRSQQQDHDLKDLVGQPLTMWVWMFPRDKHGSQQKDESVLVMQHDFTFVGSQNE